MNNSSRQMTNRSFKNAIAAIIDKLKENVTPTTIPDDIDDFEALNSDVFDAGMAELLKAIPAGGSGGGGSSNIEILEFTMAGTTVSTVLTAGEIKNLVSNGKMLIGRTHPQEGVVTTLNISFINSSDNGMEIFFISEGQIYSIELNANSDNDVFSGELGDS